MKKFVQLLSLTAILLGYSVVSYSQHLVDGFFDQKGALSLTLGYMNSSGDAFYVGETLMSPIPAHNEITQNIFSLYGKYAVSDRFMLVLSAPYISAEGDGVADPINGETEVDGLQDINILGKYKLASLGLGIGNIDFLAAGGFSFPTGYEPNGVLSIGSGAFATNLHLGAHLQTNVGVFATLVGGYSFRGDADNEFGTNGGGDFDVPDASLWTAKVGWAVEWLYLDAYLNMQFSSDGVDIMGPGFMGNLPETEVNYTMLGFTAYVPLVNGLGISAGYATILDGRNITESDNICVGVTYNF